jgi:hypothetical protein
MSYEYRDDRPSRWPPDFGSWPRVQQINVVSRRMTREGLIKEMLNMADLPTDGQEFDKDRKLTKKELSAIYLAIQGVEHDG